MNGIIIRIRKNQQKYQKAVIMKHGGLVKNVDMNIK